MASSNRGYGGNHDHDHDHDNDNGHGNSDHDHDAPCYCRGSRAIRLLLPKENLSSGEKPSRARRGVPRVPIGWRRSEGKSKHKVSPEGNCNHKQVWRDEAAPKVGFASRVTP